MKIEFSGEVISKDNEPVLMFNRKVLTAALQGSIGEKVRIIVQTEGSIGQNDKFHKQVRILSEYMGESFDYCKKLLKLKFLGTETIVIDGKEFEEVKSFSSLSKDERTLFIAQVEHYIDNIINN